MLRNCTRIAASCIRSAQNSNLNALHARNFAILGKKFSVNDTFRRWRMSEDNFLDLHVTEEDLEVIVKAQEALSKEQRCHCTPEQAEAFLTDRSMVPHNKLEEAIKWFTENVRRGPRYYGHRMYYKITQRAEDPEYLARFGIDRKDYAAFTYFLILHAWVVKRRLMYQGLYGINHFIWDLCWLHCKVRLRTEENLSEVQSGSGLNSVREYSVGLLFALEESLEDPDLGLGQFEWLLLTNLYNNKIDVNDPKLRDLSAYLLYLNEFMLALPDDEFKDGFWKFPDWPRKDLPAEILEQAEKDYEAAKAMVEAKKAEAEEGETVGINYRRD